MANCPLEPQLAAFHDGQLDAADRERFEHHLAQCEPCRGELAQFEGMSQLFAAVPRARLSQIAVHRLQHNVEATMQRGVLRLARVLSAVAACIVLAGSLRLTSMKTTAAPQQAPPWVDVAASANADSSVRALGSPAARWYLADASHSGEDLP